MGTQQAVQRVLVIKAGMTPQDIINSKEATAQQKKMAYVFDSDGIAGYSQREADVFNATLISDKGKNGISLWTRYKDGSKRETKFKGDLSSFKYVPQGDVQPYVTVTYKPSKSSQAGSANAAAEIDKFIAEGKGKLEVQTYDNGIIKKKCYTDNNMDKRISVEYYENGTKKSERVQDWIGSGFSDTKRVEYYPNGKVKSSYTMDKNMEKKTHAEFYENGTKKSEREEDWIGSGFSDTKRVEYYPNGKVKSSYTMDKNMEKRTQAEFYENGNKKSYIVETWENAAVMYENSKGEYEYLPGFKATTEVYYDQNGNVIDKATVKK